MLSKALVVGSYFFKMVIPSYSVSGGAVYVISPFLSPALPTIPTENAGYVGVSV